MTLSTPKALYSRFLSNLKGTLHFAAHSHHFWPDVSREAHLQYWDDSAQFSDGKWDKIFSEVLPKTQTHIARILNLRDRTQIALAPNTHELISRILSLFVGRKELKLLTTSSEFHSWRRQYLRLAEFPEVSVTQIETRSLLEDRQKFLDSFIFQLEQKPDLVYLSQVFFDSGLALTDIELQHLVRHCHQETIFVIDGYHAFAALPTDLSSLEGRVFYLGGGYKYAQAGEGVCFLVAPKGNWRPVNTGWFAEFRELSRPSGTQVGYAKNGMAFMGATQDFSGAYRFNAVWDLFEGHHFSIAEIHAYVRSLQETFINEMPDLKNSLQLQYLFSDLSWHGHFITFAAEDAFKAQAIEEKLRKHKIIIDRRAERLRFGFGLYQDQSDVVELCSRLKKLAL